MGESLSKELSTTMVLRCELTEKRHRELEDEMAFAKTEIDRLDEELERQKEAHRQQVKELARRLKAAATISKNGFEMLSVGVVKVFDRIAWTVRIRRLDTGEWLEPRKCTPEEKTEFLKYVSEQKQRTASHAEHSDESNEGNGG